MVSQNRTYRCNNYSVCIYLYDFHNDTEHYFIINKAFWRSRAFNYSALGQEIPSSHPSVHQNIVPKPSEVRPYDDMADILVRIPWGLIMTVLFLLAGGAGLFAVSAAISYACKMCCGSETNTNRHMTESHQTRTSVDMFPEKQVVVKLFRLMQIQCERVMQELLRLNQIQLFKLAIKTLLIL